MHACVSCSATPACHTPSFLEWSQEPRSHAQGLRGGGKSINRGQSSFFFSSLDTGHGGNPFRDHPTFHRACGPSLRCQNPMGQLQRFHRGICGWMIRWSSGRVTLVRQGASRQRAVQLGLGFGSARMRETRTGPRAWEPPSHERPRPSLVRARACPETGHMAAFGSSTQVDTIRRMGGNPKNPFPPEDEDLTEADPGTLRPMKCTADS